MKNVYDIRKEEQLQFVLSTEHSLTVPSHKKLQSAAVVVNLFYTEKVKYYCQYLDRLPEDIVLYIFSSKEETLLEAKKYLNNKNKNIMYLNKENRGRDVSALLVAFQPYLDKYKTICFIHDKKEHGPRDKTDVDKWNENLWGNMIASSHYVYNVLNIFETCPELGILFPPEPIGENKMEWFHYSWDENYNNCRKLADKMYLTADIRKEKPPIALGSVFWARKEVLIKLFNIGWKYEDFSPEPMPLDSTISHAVERIFSYIAQDAGYEAGTVMTEKYAAWQLLFLQDNVRMMFSELSERMGVDNINQIRMLHIQTKAILNYAKAHHIFFLYGAGKCGRAVLKLLRENKIEPNGFVVTDDTNCKDSIEGIKIYSLDDIKTKKCGIILTTYYPLQEEMMGTLENYGMDDFFLVFDKKCSKC